MKSFNDCLAIEPSDLIKFLRENGISAISAERYQNGIASDNFRVRTDSGELFVARCDYRRHSELVIDDRAFSQAAFDGGVPVPHGPWLDRNISGVALSVRPAVNGQTVDCLDSEKLPKPKILGSILSKIHTSKPPSIERPYFYQFLLCPSDKRWELIPEKVPEFSSNFDLDALFHIAREKLNVIQKVGLPDVDHSRMIHGDFTPSNILIENKSLTILDWEKSTRGPCESDIGQYIVHFSRLWQSDKKGNITEFLSGYYSGQKFDLYHGPTLWDWVKAYAVAFYLTDAAFAVVNSVSPNPNSLRERYFTGYCSEAFSDFVDAEQEIEDVVLSFSS